MRFAFIIFKVTLAINYSNLFIRYTICINFQVILYCRGFEYILMISMNYFILFIFLFPYIHTQNPTTTHLTSEIKFGYGLMYESWGLMLHGLNRYYLIVGLEIPIFNFTKDRTIDYFTNYKKTL